MNVVSADARFVIHVTPEMIRHSRILDILYFSGFAYGVIELLLILALGVSARMRDAALRVTKRPYVVAIIYVFLFTVVTAIIDFPLSYYAGFVVPHEFRLTHQTFASWLGDEAKALMIGLVFALIIVPPALAFIRRFKRWWLGLWIASIPLTIFLVVVVPVIVDPVFNKFEPLRDPILKQRLLDEASRAGIAGSRVYQVNKSKQTTTMNAYVTGLGPTKRIVIWDTTLAKMTSDEIVAVMGHEMGHYVLHHIWKGTAAAIAGTFVILFIGQYAYEYGLRRWGSRWRASAPGDAATLPWLLVLIAVMNFLGAPIQNGVSRYIEHQADQFGLELTHLNEATASSFVKFAVDSKVNPYPNRFIEFWRYSHPSLARRIDFVLHYKPWEQGKPNELWKRTAGPRSGHGLRQLAAARHTAASVRVRLTAQNCYVRSSPISSCE